MANNPSPSPSSTTDRWLVIADSNRSQPHLPSDPAIVDTRAALAGQFPRDLARIPGQDAVVVSDHDSQQVELAQLATLH